jgi:MATE family multidrug resistance protein
VKKFNIKHLSLELQRIKSLAWPILIAQISQTLMSVSDIVMAGRASATDMAGVALATSVLIPLLYFLQGIMMALPAIISRLIGEKRKDYIAKFSQHAIILSIVVGSGISIFGTILLNSHYLWINPIPMIAVAREYMSYAISGIPIVMLYQSLRYTCEGMHRTKPGMIITMLGLLVNLPMNLLFIHGVGAFEGFGGAGAGIATVIVYCTMLSATLVYCKKSKHIDKVKIFHPPYYFSFHVIGEIIKVGLPIAFAILFEISLFSVTALLLIPYGDTTVAAHHIALNMSALLFMVPASIGMATTVRVGTLLGQKRNHQAQVSSRSAVILGAGLAFFNAFLVVIFRVEIASFYTSNEIVVALAIDLLLLMALFQLSDAFQVITAGILRGYKDTKVLLYITFFSYWLIGFPLGVVLGLTNWVVPPMAAAGLWIGIILGLTCSATLMTLRLRITQKRDIEKVLVLNSL